MEKKLHTYYMQKALDQAQEAFENNEVPMNRRTTLFPGFPDAHRS